MRSIITAKLRINSEKTRFALVGGVNTALDFGLYGGLSAIGVNPILANYISTSCAFIFSFIANRKFTFTRSTGNVKRQLVLFLVVTLFGLWVIQPLVILVSHALLTPFGLASGWFTLLPKLIATFFSLTWNYLLYSRVVFTSDEARETIKA